MLSKATFTAGSKTVSSAGTGERLVAASTLVTQVTIQARKVGGDNTGIVYLGKDATTKYLALSPGLGDGAGGDVVTIDAATGMCFDLYDIFLNAATSADGVTFTYLKVA